METIFHLFTSLDISGAILHALQSVFNSLVHGFQDSYALLYPVLKQLIEIYPGLVSGVLIISSLYLIYSVSGSLKGKLIRIRSSK